MKNVSPPSVHDTKICTPLPRMLTRLLIHWTVRGRHRRNGVRGRHRRSGEAWGHSRWWWWLLVGRSVRLHWRVGLIHSRSCAAAEHPALHSNGRQGGDCNYPHGPKSGADDHTHISPIIITGGGRRRCDRSGGRRGRRHLHDTASGRGGDAQAHKSGRAAGAVTREGSDGIGGVLQVVEGGVGGVPVGGQLLELGSGPDLELVHVHVAAAHDGDAHARLIDVVQEREDDVLDGLLVRAVARPDETHGHGLVVGAV
mmetsp:Transcript_64456/g.106714  ORF Transcript_64456/g.106714 Transcript_64456/m.106714 type:complete len:255 (-) Transcript_64456:9345-10109(-)